MKRSELKELIREELHAILNERSLAEAEFTSAGSVPRKHGRKMSQAQISKRDTLGRKILSALDKGKNTNNSLRKAFKKWAAKNDHPISSEKTMKSYAWAMASDWAIRGKEFPPVHESVEENVNELKASTLQSYRAKADKNLHGRVTAASKVGLSAHNKTKIASRIKGIGTASTNLKTGKFTKEEPKPPRPKSYSPKYAEWQKKYGDARKALKVKNPKTGEEILALSAYHAGPLHPAYAIAKAALKRKK